MAKYDPNDPTRHTTHQDTLTHTWLLQELCEVIERREMAATRLEFYRHAVESYPIAALKAVMHDLYGQSPMPTKLPSPAELRSLVRHHAPRQSTASGSIEDERWRRQYDVWQRGRFSDDALEVAFSLSDEELGVGLEGQSDESYVPCQHLGCLGQISWPTDRRDSGRMFCIHHQPTRGEPVTTEDKRRIFQQATAKARAFLRSIDAIARQIRDIPITAEEQAAAEADAVPLRARAFEHTAEGPGVNPSIFLNHPYLAIDLPEDYRERRQIMAAAGWKFSSSDGQWHRGKRTVTDGTIDGFPSLVVLQEYVGRSS